MSDSLDLLRAVERIVGGDEGGLGLPERWGRAATSITLQAIVETCERHGWDRNGGVPLVTWLARVLPPEKETNDGK